MEAQAACSLPLGWSVDFLKLKVEMNALQFTRSPWLRHSEFLSREAAPISVFPVEQRVQQTYAMNSRETEGAVVFVALTRL